MQIGITFKLFAAILATSIVVVAVMVAAQRLSFRRDFLAYVNRSEITRVETLAQRLGGAYDEAIGWEALRAQGRRWRRLLREHMDPGGERPVLPERDPRHRHRRWLAPASMPAPDPLRLGPRLTLVDAGRAYVAGNPRPADDAIAEPIIRDGQTVGWLLVSPFTELTSALDLHFQRRQARAALFIGALAIVLAALVALLLARHLLRPVHRLARATRALTDGQLDTRIAGGGGDELGRLADDFNRLAATLEHNEQARRALGADISHELRTPVAVLRGELEALHDGVRPLTREAIASLQQEVTVLGKLIDDLYELALADAGALDYAREPLDLRMMLETALAPFRALFAARNITLELVPATAPLPVLADAGRLRQLFANLAENALRYTDPGGRVRVVAAARDRTIEVDFQDSPPGVPESLLPRLFERLFRVEPSRSRALGGAGLGLTICRNIAQAHGGRIEARPSPLGGLWIALTLPRAEGGQGEGGAPA